MNNNIILYFLTVLILHLLIKIYLLKNAEINFINLREPHNSNDGTIYNEDTSSYNEYTNTSKYYEDISRYNKDASNIINDYGRVINIKTNLSLILVPIYRYSITSSHFIDSTLVSIILK